MDARAARNIAKQGRITTQTTTQDLALSFVLRFIDQFLKRKPCRS